MSTFSTGVRIVRLMCAAFSGGLITIFVTVLAFLLRPCGLQAANVGAHLWGRVGSAICYSLMGIRVEVLSSPEGLDPLKPVVFFGSHPRTYQLMAYARAISRACPWRVIAPSVKSEHKWNPFGWGVKLMGGILLNRADGDEAVFNLKQSLMTLRRLRFALSIYVDGSRGNAEARQKALGWVCEQDGVSLAYRELYRISQRLLMPRQRGIQAIREVLPEAQYVRVDMAGSRAVDSLSDLIKGPAPKIRVRLVRTEPPPMEKVELLNVLLGHAAEAVAFMQEHEDRS